MRVRMRRAAAVSPCQIKPVYTFLMLFGRDPGAVLLQEGPFPCCPERVVLPGIEDRRSCLAFPAGIEEGLDMAQDAPVRQGRPAREVGDHVGVSEVARHDVLGVAAQHVLQGPFGTGFHEGPDVLEGGPASRPSSASRR